MSSWTPEGQDEGTLNAPSTSLVSLADVKSWLGYSTTTKDDAMLTNMVTAACDWIERFAGPIAPTNYVERYDGWAGSELILRHAPVISIAYVHEFWSTGGLHDLSESTPANTIDGYQLEKETGRLVRVFQGNWPRTWFPGSHNVEISYQAGCSPIPPIAQLAAFELIQHWWQQQHQQQAAGFGGQINTEAEATTDTAPGPWLGVPKSVLDKVKMLRTPVLA